MTCYAGIAVSIPTKSIDRLFTYKIPEQFEAQIDIGSVVKIPFGAKTEYGYVIEISETPPNFDREIEIKEILEFLHNPQAALVELAKLSVWLKNYYGCPLISALTTAFPINATFTPPKKYIVPASGITLEFCRETLKKSKTRLHFMEQLYLAPNQRKSYTKNMSRTAIELLAAGFITIKELDESIPYSNIEISESKKSLNSEQILAIEKLKAMCDSDRGEAALLYGVTCSGKTEVYINACEHVIKNGGSAILLLPEINLTAQYAERIKSRFGSLAAILHSRLTKKERRTELQRVLSGKARIVLGARSAIFAPVQNLKLIIVDEEHEKAYKQDRTPFYHVRTVAIQRMLYNRAALIFGSATPSLESYLHAKIGSYHFISLPTRAVGVSPEIQIVDMRRSYNQTVGSLFSPILLKKIRNRLDNHEQIMLFINRRGFFNYIICADCGHIIFCDRCSIAMRVYKNPPLLRCHYCNKKEPIPDLCPKCGGHSLTAKGGGTQRVEEELHKIFPEVRVLRLDSDQIKSSKTADMIYSQFKNGMADILVGTQIIAKGFDFPNVTLAGVISADALLTLPDFRAAENSFQTILQFIGRPGRGSDHALGLIQTYNPEHPAILAIKHSNYQKFYEMELDARRELSYPPFMHMIRIIFKSFDREILEERTYRFKTLFKLEPEEQLTGPAPCPIHKIDGIMRAQITIRSNNVVKVAERYRALEATLENRNLSMVLDCDSYSFL